jgi:hypothetical protein
MISFDLECVDGHKFEGIFRDYESFSGQLEKKMVRCPLCDSIDIKRLYSGCSIQARPASKQQPQIPNLFELVKKMRKIVTENFENVGRDFPEIARDIHYGHSDERNIYGEATASETKELIDEGIGVVPLPDVEKLEN